MSALIPISNQERVSRYQSGGITSGLPLNSEESMLRDQPNVLGENEDCLKERPPKSYIVPNPPEIHTCLDGDRRLMDR